MFTEIIEPLQWRPGPAAKRRKLSNLLLRIKIEMFGKEALQPDFIVGKDVREMNMKLIRELIRRMLSRHNSFIEKVYQPEEGSLSFYIQNVSDAFEYRLALSSLLGDYEMLDVAERYPVSFQYVPCEIKEKYENENWPIIYKHTDAGIYKTGKA
ncbi:hypothetical protein [Chitinophaga deserti]|uniref:hypothetical protein n=1 Tax=Chitinophaga deserti TaxID=2164099 RepID=UPI000D6CF17A|nr:hypothetical protein [Chitinophaga deserti]